MTFWGTEFFQSETSDEVEYGTTLEAAIVRQVDEEKVPEAEAFESTSHGLIGTFLVLQIPLLFFVGESLLPVWLLLITL